jgi:diketogulonate reductase-like aldo/keto reductase
MLKTKIRMDRRRFLQQSAGLTAAALSWPGLLSAKQLAPIKKAIPKTGEQLPVIGMGTSRTFDIGNDPAQRQRLAEVLQIFFDQGGALIDSSPMYGNAEQVTGDLLKIIKNKQALFAATKVWTWGRQEGITQMQRSSQRMGVKVFDLMQIHNLRDWEVQLETLKAWKVEGKVRYIGITTSHGRFHDELEVILDNEPFDFVQLSYNIMNRTVEQRLLPIARERGIATLINRPFARGDLFQAVKGQALPAWASDIGVKSWGQFFLKFVVSHPAVTCAIPATSKPHHMLDNMGAGFGRLPDAAMRQQMIRYIEALA